MGDSGGETVSAHFECLRQTDGADVGPQGLDFSNDAATHCFILRVGLELRFKVLDARGLFHYSLVVFWCSGQSIVGIRQEEKAVGLCSLENAQFVVL